MSTEPRFACDLNPGDVFLDHDGEAATVTSIDNSHEYMLVVASIFNGAVHKGFYAPFDIVSVRC